MGLIPIPQEVVAKAVKSTKQRIIRQIRGKLKHKENSRNERILKNTCIKMSEYIIDNGKFKADDVDSLIDDMHRSILTLQKKKQKLLKKRKKSKS